MDDVNGMTREEAIRTMALGIPVTHRYFSNHEDIVTDGQGNVVDEMGYRCRSKIFWSYRMGSGFDTGWSVAEV